MRSPRRLLIVAALLALPALAACGGGGDGEGSSSGASGGSGGTVTAQGPATAQTAAVTATEKLRFEPSTVLAKPGVLALTMNNPGGVPHDLVFKDKTVGAGIGIFSGGSRTGTFRFPAAGTFDFECTLHTGMVGKVVVG